nr:hypothetical protein [Tanacetum cinerariifolium]
MDTTIEQQLAMDEALIPTAQRLKIGRSNFRLLSDIKDILHICPRVHGQPFVEPPFEEEILAFIHFLGHSAAIRTLTDVNINKLYQPWRSFAALINKCLTGKSSGYDSLRLSQAQNLWGLYHKRNVDYAYLMWEDFVYQVEHKNQKKCNEMYYPRFTKAIIYHFMSKDPSIPRRNKVNWHYVRDDFMFSMIKLVSIHQNTQQFGALLPIEPTNDEIRSSKAYKEYYAIAIGEAAPKPKASVRRTRSRSNTSITSQTTAATPRLTASTKGKQTAKASKVKSLSALSEVAMTEAQQLKLVTKQSMQQTHISQPSGSGADEGTGSKPWVPDVPTDESKEELSWNSTDDEGDDNGKQDNDGDEEDEGDDGEKGNDDGDGEEDLGLNIGEEERHDEKEEEDELYRDESSSVSSQFVTSMLTPTLDVGMKSIFETTSQLDVLTPTSVAPLPITTSTMTSSTIATTTTSQAPILPTTVSSDVKEQVKAQVSKIFLRIEQDVNEQLEAEVLTRSSHSSRTSYVVAADLSEMELKKILTEKMEGNKSIQRSNEQRNLYKALVDAYESDKIILDTYGETVTLKRQRDDDADKDEQPSAGPDRGSKRRREGKEPESASAPTETATRSACRSTQGSRSRQSSASESALAEEPMQTTSQMEEPSHLEFDTGAYDQPIVQSSQHPEWFSPQQKPPTPNRDCNKTLPAVHGSIQPWISELAKQADSRSSFNELMDTPLDFSNFLINRLRVDTLTPKLLAGPTYKLMNRSYKSLVELEYHLEEVYKAIIDQLDWVNPEGQQYPHNLLQPLPLILNNRGRRVIPFEHFINNDLEYLRGGASSRLCGLQNQLAMKSMPSEESPIEGVNRRVEDLQLGVESYQKKLNLTNLDSNRSDLKHKEAYTAYSNPRGFIYQNKDKRNRLMRINELHKFSDGTLTDVRTDLDDRLKGIRMQYLPQSIWRKSDKDRNGLLEEGYTRENSGCYKGPYDLSYAAPIFQEMEILLESISNKLMVGYELRIGNEFSKMTTLSVGHKTTLVSDSLIDFQIKFSLSIGEIVTHWFTLIVLSALRCSDSENMLSVVILILRSILTD